MAERKLPDTKNWGPRYLIDGFMVAKDKTSKRYFVKPRGAGSDARVEFATLAEVRAYVASQESVDA